MSQFKVLETICKTVGNTLGKGFSECIYQEAICSALRKQNINYSREVTIPIYYNGDYTGNVRADIITEDTIIECKAIDANLRLNNVPQLSSYLVHCVPKRNHGILVNFNQNPSKAMVEIINVSRDPETNEFEANLNSVKFNFNSRGQLLSPPI